MAAEAFVEAELSGAMVANALKTHGQLGEARVRLPYSWTPNKVAKEIETLSVAKDIFSDMRQRALSRAESLRLIVATMSPRELQFPATCVALREFRNSDPALWKAMILATVIDALKRPTGLEIALPYYDGKQSLGITFARLIGIPVEHARHFELFAMDSQIRGIRLDPLTDAAVLRLQADTWLHAQRTANNAKVGEIYLIVVLSVIAFLEMGLGQIILSSARAGGAASFAEGLGVATAQESALAQGVFGAFMGFCGHVSTVGEILEDGEFSEDEELGYYISFAGIFIPGVFSALQLSFLPSGVQMIGKVTGVVTSIIGYCFSALNAVLWAIQSLEELGRGLEIAEALTNEGARAAVAGDSEYEIIIPPMPEESDDGG